MPQHKRRENYTILPTCSLTTMQKPTNRYVSYAVNFRTCLNARSQAWICRQSSYRELASFSFGCNTPTAILSLAYHVSNTSEANTCFRFTEIIRSDHLQYHLTHYFSLLIASSTLTQQINSQKPSAILKSTCSLLGPEDHVRSARLALSAW
ncbi:hypothetical protein HBI24_145930 [Parastagonospora nodorum]|nr:hypothetical protein HBI10_142840 [Parastagonospora nodorum]KAH4021078.1 hypothetical protein HBI13_111140 [Parastagonospora nodorum]KAH4115862.1 hypothetical protein HBH47_176930 [Parastagonospora nodorum]KAH4902744.1 hypothetical protein HBI80_127280 [Parastagonospora nodorum]KAH4914369.1 hypothetical protein HBH74_152500 [Parastagonospora nodorum]